MWLQFSLLFLTCTFQLGAAAIFDLEDLELQNLMPLTFREIQTEPVNKEKLKYRLCTSKNPDNCTILDPSNPQLSPEAPIVIFIHGFLDTVDGFVAKLITDAFLQRDDQYQVIVLDWDIYSDQFLYKVAVNDTKEVGRLVAECIFNWNSNFSIPPENMMIVGHSLGGQMTGFIGQRYREIANKTLSSTLIALDPAGPDFRGKSAEDRLDSGDAIKVIAIHTDGDHLGFYDRCGTIDYYPEGGKDQPGCLLTFLTHSIDFIENLLCDHLRAVYLFVAALKNPEAFPSRQCEDWNQYKTSPDSCPSEFEYMGNLETNKTGKFYCKTGPPPY